MIRVALSTCVVQRGRSGISAYLFGLLEGLKESKAAVDLFLLGLEEDRKLFEPWLDRFRWVSISELWRPPVFNILWHQTFLRSVLKKHAIDVLHIPSYRRIVYRSACPQVVTIHDCAPFHLKGKYDFFRMFYGRHIVKRLVQKVDAVIAISHFTAGDIERFYQIPKGRIHLVYNGIDHHLYQPLDPQSARRALQEKWDISSAFFLYLARLEHPAKNHVGLIEAFEGYVKEYQGQEDLVLAGADWDGAEIIHKRIDSSALRNRIHRLGFVEKKELPTLYNAALALVYPSFFEGFGLPPIEAMACGCPVISSKAGALEEVVDGAACIIDPRNLQGMIGAMRRVASDQVCREQLRDAGFSHAASFCWKRAAQEVSQIYKNTCKKV